MMSAQANDSYSDVNKSVYYDLLRPLNIVDGKICVDENPHFNLSANKEFQSLLKIYANAFGNDFIPIKINVSNDGFVREASLYTPLMIKDNSGFDLDAINNFFNRLLGVQFSQAGAIKYGKNVAYTAVISLSNIGGQLILNPILH
jgi:hypothetical protein